jgi:hypothetical protein
VSKVIDKFNVKKATGVDKISVKLLKLGKPSLVNPITNLINISIDNCHFPKRLKEAQVVPHNLLSKISCGRQSKAFDISISIAAKYSLLSKAFFQSSSSLNNVVWQPWHLLIIVIFQKDLKRLKLSLYLKRKTH